MPAQTQCRDIPLLQCLKALCACEYQQTMSPECQALSDSSRSHDLALHHQQPQAEHVTNGTSPRHYIQKHYFAYLHESRVPQMRLHTHMVFQGIWFTKFIYIVQPSIDQVNRSNTLYIMYPPNTHPFENEPFTSLN